MLVVVSPAKKLDMSPKAENLETSEPIFSDDVDKLAKVAANLSEKNLQDLIKISPSLARLLSSFPPLQTRPAPPSQDCGTP